MIRAVERALAIFDAFDAKNPTLTLQEIGTRIALSKATTFRLVNTLDQAGYLVRMGDQKYALSLKFVRLAGLVSNTLTLRDIARPIMAEVTRRTGETVTLNTIEGHERLCIEVTDTPAPLMHIVRPGEQVPLVYGATGKILLAYMDAADRARVLEDTGESGRIDSEALERQLAIFRRQGYALTSGERVLGVTAISVPLPNMEGNVRHCLSLTGPAVRIDPRAEEFRAIILEAGADVTRRIGGKPALEMA